MLNLQLYFAFILASLIFILFPGPSATLVFASGMQGHFARTLTVICGILLADLIYMVLAGLGIGIVIARFRDFFSFFKLIASLYLIFLGVKTIKNTSKMEKQEKIVKVGTLKKSFTQGFFISITNPTTITFFSAFFPLYIDLNYRVGIQLTSLIATFISLAFIVLYIYGLLGKKIISFTHSRSKYILNRLMGILLLAMGSYMVIHINF